MRGGCLCQVGITQSKDWELNDRGDIIWTGQIAGEVQVQITYTSMDVPSSGAIGMTWRHTVTNLQEDALVNLCFGRYIDPDQGQPHGWGYGTHNSVLLQPGKDGYGGADGQTAAITASPKDPSTNAASCMNV